MKWTKESPLDWVVNKPCEVSIDDETGVIVIETEEETDFWQNTHYNFQRDDGHFLGQTVADGQDFVFQATVSFEPNAQYDQAGVMVRVSESCWLKASVEFESQQEPVRRTFSSRYDNCVFIFSLV